MSSYNLVCRSIEYLKLAKEDLEKQSLRSNFSDKHPKTVELSEHYVQTRLALARVQSLLRDACETASEISALQLSMEIRDIPKELAGKD